jgi:MFS family permease
VTDVRLVFGAQAARAYAYGLGAVLLGSTLDRHGFSSTEVGVVLAAVLTGTVIASVVLARYGERIGRRRAYIILYAALALTGVVFAFSNSLLGLVAVALTGALSTEVVESGPFTSLEQAMIAGELEHRRLARGFGVYNAVATAAGSLGALSAAVIGDADPQRWFLVLVPAALLGIAFASRLSASVEVRTHVDEPGVVVEEPRTGLIWKLSGLFAIDSFAGGFTVQSFIAYYLTTRFGASIGTVGVVFFVVGILQTASFLAAGRLGDRFGLLNTMFFSHLPSNMFLIAIAFAPNLHTAVVLLFLRTMLSQMDVPTRQAYVMAMVPARQRVTAAATTNTARYLVRPVGPLLAGASQSVALGLPFFIAGSLKAVYDLMIYGWFRKVPLAASESTATTAGAAAEFEAVAAEEASGASMNDSHSPE